jgi:proline iminopeptidase
VYAKIDDVELFYESLGTGMDIVALHGGLGLDHTYLRRWLDPLADVARLVYCDLRGNGRSSRKCDVSVLDHATWARDVEAVREQSRSGKIVLFGHSYGAFLAQEYALRYPERVRGLILCSAAPVIDYHDVIMKNAQARATAAQMAAIGQLFSGPMPDDETFRDVWQRVLPVYFHRYDGDVVNASMRDIQYSAAAFNQSSGRCLPEFNTLGSLRDIRVPTLLLAGRHDWITPPAPGAERMHAALPFSRLELFEESGHFPFIEEPKRFLSTTKSWLNQLA